MDGDRPGIARQQRGCGWQQPEHEPWSPSSVTMPWCLCVIKRREEISKIAGHWEEPGPLCHSPRELCKQGAGLQEHEAGTAHTVPWVPLCCSSSLTQLPSAVTTSPFLSPIHWICI